jgi:hypothetical protein
MKNHPGINEDETEANVIERDGNFATIAELISAAHDDGHADAMDLCAKTDEQRLRLISELTKDCQTLFGFVADVAATRFYPDQIHSTLLQICLDATELHERFSKPRAKPRPIEVASGECIIMCAEKAKQMRESFNKQMEEEAE